MNRSAPRGGEGAIGALRGVSPVAWRHVNLIGRFEFKAEAPPLDIDALAARYAEKKARTVH